MATKNETVKVVTPQQIIQSHEKRVLESLQAHQINQRMFVHFPNRRSIPLLGRLGVWLVNKTGGIIATKYDFVGGTMVKKKYRQ